MTTTQKRKQKMKEERIRALKKQILFRRIKATILILLVSVGCITFGVKAIKANFAPKEEKPVTKYITVTKTVDTGDSLYSLADEILQSLSEEERDLPQNGRSLFVQRMQESNPELGTTLDYASRHLYPGMMVSCLVEVYDTEEAVD